MILGAGTAIVAILLVAGAILFWRIRHVVLAEFDRGVMVQAKVLVTEVVPGRDAGAYEVERGTMPWFEQGQRRDFFELWDAAGRILQRSGSLGTLDLDRHATPVPNEIRPVCLPNGRPGRQVTMLVTLPDKTAGLPPGATTTLTLVMARNTSSLEDVLQDIFWCLVGVVAMITLTCLFILVRVVTRGVKPVRQLGASLNAIEEHQLSQRLDLAGIPEELRPVVDGLNQLLVRLEAAWSRERAFSADLAHELRTPLYGLRAKLDVALIHPRTPEAYEKTLRECLDITLATQGMAETLLTLARLDSGQLAVHREPLALRGFLQSVWEPVARRAAERQLQVVWEGAEMMVESDPERLRLVLNTLYDNAISHANAGGEIRIRLHAASGAIEVEIANSGSQVAADDAGKAFDRFWRGDASRNGVGTHCGLGLPLAQRVMQLLGHEIAVTTEAGGWFRVFLRFPPAQRRNGVFMGRTGR
jgi:two-component system sensor histidine kinase QseC